MRSRAIAKSTLTPASAAAAMSSRHWPWGAKAVGIGRPLFWGLAINGAEGVHGVLELLREEIDRAMAYCGQTSVQDLEPNLVNVPQGWGAPPQPDF